MRERLPERAYNTVYLSGTIDGLGTAGFTDNDIGARGSTTIIRFA